MRASYRVADRARRPEPLRPCAPARNAL